jgi:hypothetical protein
MLKCLGSVQKRERQLYGGRARAPKHLSAGAKKVWQEIVAGYPDDYFQPGATILLEQLCTVIVLGRQLAPLVAECPDDSSIAALYLKYMQACATHATKLRLTVQSSVHRRAGILDEGAPPKGHLLYGSDGVKF